MSDASKKPQLSYLFTRFLDEFYEPEKIIFMDSLLTKTMILPNQAGSINEFLDEVGDYVFKKYDKCNKDFKGNIEKSTDLNKQYCDFVNLIKINEEFDNFFLSDKYKTLSGEIMGLEIIKGEAEDDLNNNKMQQVRDLRKEYKGMGYDEEEIKQEVNVFLANFRDIKNAAIINDANRQLKGLEIEMQKMLDEAGISKSIMMVYNARIKCDKSQDPEIKNFYNMLIEGSIGGGGYYAPMIRANSATLKAIGNSLVLSKENAYANKQTKEDKEEIREQASKNSNDAERAAIIKQKEEECNKLGRENAAIPERSKYLSAIFGESAGKQKAQAKIKQCEKELRAIKSGSFFGQSDEKYEEFKKEAQNRKAKNLERFKKLDEDEKQEKCKDNNYVKYFSEKSIKSYTQDLNAAASYGIISGSINVEVDKSESKTSVSCISFKGVYSIPLRYSYLEKGIYKLDFSDKNHGVSLNMKELIYEQFKDFVLDRCLIPKAVIVGSGMKAHFKRDLLKEFDIDGKVGFEIDTIFRKAGKVESTAGYSHYDEKTGGFDINEPDVLVVLGYELEDLCKEINYNYYEHECSSAREDL